MATLVVEKEGPELFSFQLQWQEKGKVRRESLRFGAATGKATRHLPAGTYALGWAVTGDPGDEFSYTVTLDDQEVETNEGKLTQKDRAHGGAIRVKVKA